jgi:hypothetical protein
MSTLIEARPGTVWLGPEATIHREYRIPAQTRQLIEVKIEPVNDLRVVFDANTTRISTRSKVAQKGGEVPINANPLLGKHLKNSTGPLTLELPFINWSSRPIELPELPGGEIFRAMRREGPAISGAILENLLAGGKIMPGGKENVDWWVAKNEYEEAVGIGLYIKTPEQWLPPSTIPLRTTSETTGGFREEMRSHFKDIREIDNAIIRISETHNTLLTTEDYMAFLDPDTTAVAPAGVRIMNPQQINAPALYGGYPREAWPIRTELISTADDLGLSSRAYQKAIVATFFHVANPIQ